MTDTHNLTELQVIVHEWANEQFPHREPSIAWMKLFEELGEVIRDPSDSLEWADVIIIILDLAAIYGVTNLDAAVIEKMTINRGRVWGKTATGVMKHVGNATVAPPLIEKRTIKVDAGPLFDVRTAGCPFEYGFPVSDPVPPPYFYPADDNPGVYVFAEEYIGLARMRWYSYKWHPEGVPF